MKDMNLNDWLSLVGTVGVLAGLILVTFELRTINDMAEAEAIREGWYQDIQIDLFAIEQGIAQVRAKSIEQPLELSDEEIALLDAFLIAQMQHEIAIADMRNRYDADLLPLKTQAMSIADDLLAGAFGRGWFRANEYWINGFQPELAAEINERLANTTVALEYTWLSELREHTRRVVENE